jgi:hypothetical protein
MEQRRCILRRCQRPGCRGFYPYDNACSFAPCYNGGKCVLDTLRLLGYMCLCPAGAWGQSCKFLARLLFSRLPQYWLLQTGGKMI